MTKGGGKLKYGTPFGLPAVNGLGGDRSNRQMEDPMNAATLLKTTTALPPVAMLALAGIGNQGTGTCTGPTSHRLPIHG